MTRRAKWLASAAGGIVLLALAVAALLASDAVLRWIVARPAVQNVVEIAPDGVRGDLLGPIAIDTMVVPAAGLRAKQVEVRQRLWMLLAGRVAIEELTIGELTIAPPQSDTPQAPDQETFALPELPIDLEVASASIGRLQMPGLAAPFSEPQTLTVSGLRYDSRAISVEAGSLVGPDIRATVAGSLPLDPAAGEQLALELDLAIDESPDPRLANTQLTARAVGALPEVQVSAEVRGPAEVSLDGAFTLAGEALGINGSLRFSNLRPSVIDQPQLAGVAGALQLEGSLAQFSVNGTVELPRVIEPSIQLRLAGGWAAPELELTRVELSADAARINGEATFITAAEPALTATLDWERLDAIIDSGGFVLSRGWLDIRGPLDEVALRGNLDLVAPGDVALAAAFSGAATTTQIALERIDLNGEIGEFAGGADFSFDEGNGRLAGSVRDFNPGLLWPEYPGSISAALETSVALDDQTCPGCSIIAADVTGLSGELRQLPVDGQAKTGFVIADGSVTSLVGSASVRWGSSQAEIDVAGEEALQGDWKVSAADLTEHVTVGGTLSAQGRIEGTLSQPTSTLQIEARNLLAEGAEVSSLEASGEITLAGLPREFQARAEGIRLGTTELAALALRVESTDVEETRAVSIRGENDLVTALARAEIAREEAGWTGQLGALSANLSERGVIELETPATFTLADSGDASLAPACLTGSDLRLCIAGERSDLGSTLDLDITRFELELLSHLALIPVAIDGSVSGAAEIQALAAGEIAGQGSFELGPGSVGELGARDAPVPWLTWRRADVVLASASDRLIVSTKADLEGQDAFDLEVAFAGPGFETLDGRISARLSQLGLVSAAVPQVAAADGSLIADLRLQGTTSAPQLSGQLSLERASLSLPDLGVRWTDLNAQGELAWAGGAPALTFSGGGTSGEGRFQAEGTFRELSPLAGRVAVTGQQFLLVDRPEARLVANTDLDLTLTEPIVNVSGRVEIPEGELKAAPVSVVEASADERIVGVVDEDFETGEWQTTGRIELTLGDQLNVDASGLKAMLGGNLEIALRPEGAITGRGEIQLMDASYEAFRQTLEIERGNLRFSGGPIDNPALDFSAVRKIEDQTVGFQVRGVLKDPQLDLFSDPALSRAETLAYLTLGRSLAAASEGEQQILGDAAASAAIGSGNFVAEELGRRLGVEGRLEGNLDNASLVLGKYLSPKLYVSYGIGLFAAVDTLRLRYQLNRRLALQAESGDEEGADLIYTVEK